MKYYLIFRVPLKMQLSAAVEEPPVGGIMDCADLEIESIHEIALDRYHAGPHEYMVTSEAFQRDEQDLAQYLHEKWEEEFGQFLELMAMA